ncbi:MAG: hypothetical protein HZA50_02375 [Planctomycetes bacterium]|nr:hypothetical protein [Planctomycetota bacterium]
MKTYPALTAALVLAGISGLVFCQAPSGQSAAATQPAAQKPQDAAADLCKGAVDPYDQVSQKTKFLQAAGQDSELDAKEFDADKTSGKGFVQPFDTWRALLAHDKNSNSMIDWFEADAYRQAFRKQIMDKFDADKDGKLAGQERTDANLFLSGGKTSVIAASGPADTVAWTGGGGERGQKWGRKRGGETVEDPMKKYDANSDGQLSDEERAAMGKAIQEKWQKQTLQKYDKDGDGKLSDEERGEMRKEMRKEGAAWQEMGEKFKLQVFDADGDGKLDEKETASTKEFEKQMQDMGKKVELRFWDLNGDGQITPEERKELQKQWALAGMKMMLRATKFMDLDGDGDVSVEERQEFNQRMKDGVENYIGDTITKYDNDGDGRLSAEERANLVKGLETELQTRFDKYANQSGRVEPDAAMQMIEDFGKELGILDDKLVAPKKADDSSSGTQPVMLRRP